MRNFLARQRYLIDYTLAALARRAARNAGLVLVYASVVFMLASVMLFGQALRHEAAQLLAHAPEVVVQRMVAGRHDLLPADYLAAVGRLRGVQRVEPRLWGYFYDPVSGANFTLMAPPSNAPAAGRIAIGGGIARARNVGPGDILSLRGYSGQPMPLTVDRILPADTELVSADLMLMAESDLRAFFGLGAGVYTDLALWVANPQEVRKVAQKIAEALPDARPILRQEVLRTYESVFNWREGVVLVLFTGSILAFAILAWEKASGLSADERREIGILKAIGWETGDILRMKAWEGALLSGCAFVLGYVAAWLHVFHMNAGLFAQALKGWATLYPEFRLVPVVDGFQLATLAFFAVFPYILATVVPVWKTAITDPDAVMRGTL